MCKNVSSETVCWLTACALGLVAILGLTSGMPGAARGSKQAVAEQRTPPIILVSVDTLRADHLGCFGSKLRSTPRIDALVKGGTTFAAVNSQVPLTLPSHVSLLTSTYPMSNGVRDNGERLDAGAVTLAAVLKSNGYRTGAFVGSFVLDRRFGLDNGFDYYDSPFDLSTSKGKGFDEVKRPGDEVVNAAERWIDQNSGQPFFAFVHLYDLHAPYQLPPLRGARPGEGGYEAELNYVDAALGRFWDFLTKRGLFEKSLIVFVSDHGESLREHGENTHGYFVYQCTLWVPVIFHWPAYSTQFPSHVDEPASLTDVAPTIVQFIGFQAPRQFQGRTLPGLSSRDSSSAGREIYGESQYGYHHFDVSGLSCLRVGQYKYIDAPRPELYDLAQDPAETRNVWAMRQSLAVSYRERLLAFQNRFQSARTASAEAVEPEVAERLRSLGYVALSGPQLRATGSAIDPKDRIADYEKYGHANSLAKSGRWAEANVILEELLKHDSKLQDVRISLGLNQQKLHLDSEAVKTFRQVLKDEPLKALAHFDLGVSYLRLHQINEAVKEFEATLAITPAYTRADEALATVWLQRKDYVQGRQHLEHILSVDPGDFSGHYNLGTLDMMEGRWDEGLKHLQLALNVNPQSPDAHNALGSLYLQQGDLNHAREEFEEAARLRPEFASPHYNLGLIFSREKKTTDAMREFRLALAADPTLRRAEKALEELRRDAN